MNIDTGANTNANIDTGANTNANIDTGTNTNANIDINSIPVSEIKVIEADYHDDRIYFHNQYYFNHIISSAKSSDCINNIDLFKYYVGWSRYESSFTIKNCVISDIGINFINPEGHSIFTFHTGIFLK
jgi:CRISPR/Cas system CMR subunit Cmr6 (Cas7 group RAMP superfamily)